MTFYILVITIYLYIQVTPANRSHIQEERQAQDLDQVAVGQDLPPEAQV